jgi:hypothetical protein
VNEVDNTDMPTHVTWQTRVCLRVNVLRTHALARLEHWGRRRRSVEPAPGHHAFDIVKSELAVLKRLSRPQRMTGFDLICANQSAIDQ